LKLLLVEDDIDIREILKSMLEDIGSFDVYCAVNAPEALALLEKEKDWSCVISDFRFEGGGAPVVYKRIIELNYKIPFGLISTYGPESNEVFKNFKKDHPLNFHLPKPFTFTDLKANVEKFINPVASSKPETHVRLSPQLLLRSKPPFAIYIALSDSKFVSILKANEFDAQTIQNYQNKGVQSFYLLNEDFDRWLKQQFLENIQKFESLSDETFFFDAVEQIQVAMVHFGVTPETITMAHHLVEESLKRFDNYSKLNDLIQKLQISSSYVQQHGFLCSYLSVAMARDWDDRFTDEELKRLVMASLFKDIAFVDDPALAAIYRLSDPAFANLTSADKHRVQIHMQDAAHLLESIPEFDAMTKELVLAHHECADGSGFPRGENIITLSDLTILFMLANRFAHDLIIYQGKMNEVTSVVQNYVLDYDGTKYHDVYLRFTKTFHQLKGLV
jgi:response regulator RpfG family c-di-GMP phosphodiesterase